MTAAPSRTGRVAGPSYGPGGPAWDQPDPTRRRYSPERRRRAAARRRRLRGLGRLLVLLLIVAVSIWVGTRIAGASNDNPVERTYVVHTGDTLWNVALRSYPHDRDPRGLVYLIERRNGLSTGSLRPGQRLVLPVLGD